MLPAETKAEIAALWSAGIRPLAISRRLGVTVGQIAGLRIRGELHRAPDPGRLKGLKVDHPAVIEGRILFPGRVRDPGKFEPRRSLSDGGHALVSGINQMKLGGVVKKGAWRGMPIFSLTLEERATCPSSCMHWGSCYGNGMPFAWRLRHGPELKIKLGREIEELAELYPGGFVVRLHLLGDFVSVPYVRQWRSWLDQYPALHIFGYTAWAPSTAIGAAVAELAALRWDRFAVRLSSTEAGPGRAMTLWQTPGPLLPKDSMIVCPVQLGKTTSCATCGLCWSPAARDKTILFIAHGR